VKARVDSSASNAASGTPRSKRARIARFAREVRRAARDHGGRSLSGLEQMIGECVRGGPPRFERGVDAAGRQRRDEPRCVADEHGVARCDRRHRSADRNEAARDDRGIARATCPTTDATLRRNARRSGVRG
jgi:hypothetical protein